MTISRFTAILKGKLCPKFTMLNIKFMELKTLVSMGGTLPVPWPWNGLQRYLSPHIPLDLWQRRYEVVQSHGPTKDQEIGKIYSKSYCISVHI